MFRLILCFTIGFSTSLIHSQYYNEVGVINDNDLYASPELDQYYTNGLSVYFNTLKERPNHFFSKTILGLSLNHKIYTPLFRKETKVTRIDRPYAGYLYGTMSSLFANAKHILKFSIEFGVLGEDAGAENVQNLIHNTVGFNEFSGWPTQVETKISFGGSVTYNGFINANTNKTNETSYTITAKYTTTQAFLNSGLNHRFTISKFALADFNSNTFNSTALNRTQNSWAKELFIGLQTGITYQFTDESVTGNLLMNPTNKQFDLVPVIWQANVGIYLNLRRFNLNYTYFINTKNVKQMKEDVVRYGSLSFAYKFK